MTTLQAPKAKRIPKKLTKHNHTRTDDYYWLNNRENPEVISYLDDENTYTQSILTPKVCFQIPSLYKMNSTMR